MNKQQGLVLFFSLIVLLIMTAIAASLALNSGLSVRMSGAGAERVEALAVAQGVQHRLLKSGGFQSNLSGSYSVNDSKFNAISHITTISNKSECSETEINSDLLSCRRLEVETVAMFGRERFGQIAVVTGIEQQIAGTAEDCFENEINCTPDEVTLKRLYYYIKE